MAISAQQRKWANEYLKDFNGTEAAIRAGYTEKSAHNTAWRLRKNEEMQEYLRKRMDARLMSADEAMMHLTRIGRAPQHEAMEAYGYDMARIAREYADLVRKIKITEGKLGGKTITLEFYDRKDALKTILQANGKIDKPGDVSVEVRLGFGGVLDKVYGDDLEGES